MKKILLTTYKTAQFVLGGHGIGRFYPIRIVKDFVLKRIKSNFAIVQGHKMFLDSRDSLNLSICGIYEEYETEFVIKEIKAGDVVLDIGANIGYYTLIFSKLVGEHGKVFAFEPDPANFVLLRRNVEENGYKNVVLINKAVSDRNGKIKLFLSENNLADHRIYDSHDGRRFVEVESIKLDDYFEKNGIKINFIKMDIEGAEYGAVQGMASLLKETKNLKMISEFWPFGLKNAGVEPQKYLRTLGANGFKIYELNEKQKTTKCVDMARILKTYSVEKQNHTNLFCVK